MGLGAMPPPLFILTFLPWVQEDGCNWGRGGGGKSLQVIFTPRAHARARGYVIGRGVYYIYICKTFSYLSKYSLSDAHFSTGRLLFEFNRLQYTLAAPEVFVSSANPVILPSGYRVSIVRNTNIDQIETTPLQYCIRLNTPTPGTASYMYTA